LFVVKINPIPILTSRNVHRFADTARTLSTLYLTVRTDRQQTGLLGSTFSLLLYHGRAVRSTIWSRRRGR
jgi:hypothetical protein